MAAQKVRRAAVALSVMGFAWLGYSLLIVLLFFGEEYWVAGWLLQISYIWLSSKSLIAAFKPWVDQPDKKEESE